MPELDDVEIEFSVFEGESNRTIPQRQNFIDTSALLAVGVEMVGSGGVWARGFGFVALIFASVNIFGGFLVTQRMLAMYQKKKK